MFMQVVVVFFFSGHHGMFLVGHQGPGSCVCCFFVQGSAGFLLMCLVWNEFSSKDMQGL